jgi:5-methylcytosine-specific restriction endonuclease McrA
VRQSSVLEIHGLEQEERKILCSSQDCQSVIAVVEDGGFAVSGDGVILSITPGSSSDVLCDRRSCQTVTRVVWGIPRRTDPPKPRVAHVSPTPKKATKKPPAPPPLPTMSRVPAPMLTEEMMQVMQERWESFRIEKIRKRGTVAVGLRFDVFTRDGFRCRYCGASADDGAILHADHVIPESKGGPTTLENLVTACIDCNLGKSDKDLPT